jgi:hypothetical protein
MLTLYVSQTQTSTDNIGDIQSTSYDIASGETKGFCSSGKCLFLRFTHVFICHIFSSHLPLFSLQSVPCCLDSTTLYRVRAHTHTRYPHYPLTHSLTHTHAHTHTHNTLYANSAQTAAAEVWSWNGYKCECFTRCVCSEVPSARYFLKLFQWLQSYWLFSAITIASSDSSRTQPTQIDTYLCSFAYSRDTCLCNVNSLC